jgi:hypothetical protein
MRARYLPGRFRPAFLYQQVLHVPLEQIPGVVRATRRLPVVLSR